MTEEIPFDKASKLPGGVVLATLVSCDEQCCRGGCESWRTIFLDMISHDEEDDEESIMRFALCMNHLGEFVQDMILSAGGTLYEMDIEDDDCGDPDCPIHGHLHDDDEDDDDE